MHHGVAAQIDSFGVWQLELDGGTEDPGYVTIYIGHDHPGSGLEGHGHTHVSLNAYLTEITHTEAFGYRPILLFFECKCGSADWNCQVDQVLDAAEVIDQRGYRILDDLLHGANQYPPILQTRSTDRGYPREFTFRENMVVTIQPQPTTLDKRMGLQFGETVRITKTGTERLHHYPRKMVVIQS